MMIGIFTFLIPVIIFLLPFFHEKEKEASIVVLGDSIIGNIREETSVTSVMERELGKKVINGAFGGTCMASTNRDLKSTYYEDSLNLAILVDAIVEKNFMVQKSDINGSQFKLPYFKQGLMDLSEIDFEKVEILVIQQGTNDYNAGNPLDNPNNPYDKTTFGGALRYTIEQIQDNYPDIQIVLTTPIYCEILQQDGTYLDCAQLDFGYGSLEKYVNLEKEIAQEYGITLIDNYNELGIDETNVDIYTEDGLHLNEEGRELLGVAIARQLQ